MAQGFITFLKALAIMSLGAVSGCALTRAATGPSEPEVSAGFGVFVLLGGFFLYRAWFMGR
jgi:hypothetical protein